MIHAYSWPTPNGRKLHIMLEECGLPYELHPVNIGQGDQFKPEFLAISPNNKIPAIVDDESLGEPVSVFESGAILIYLAEKTGQFLPLSTEDPAGRVRVLEWLMWQIGGVGPMLGQSEHFRSFAEEKNAYGLQRYGAETDRLYHVADKRLADNRYLAGDSYSIADIANFSWLRSHEFLGQAVDDMPYLRRWLAEIEARPAVQRGLRRMARD